MSATYTWNGSNSTWSANTNWLDGSAPPLDASADTLVFSQGTNGVFIADGQTIGNWNISNRNFNFLATGGGSINLSDGSAVSLTTSNTTTIGARSNLLGTATFDVTSGGVISFSTVGNLTGSGGITKNGAGILTIGASSANYTRDTLVNEGTFRITTQGAMSTFSSNVSVLNSSAFFTANFSGTTTFNKNVTGSGTFLKLGAGTLTLSGSNYSNIQNDGSTDLTFGSSATISGTLSGSGSGNFSIGAGQTLDFNSNTVLSRNLGGSGAINKTGGGTLEIASGVTASHSGGTTVSAGTLLVSGTLSNAVSVTGTLAGAGRVGGLTTLNDGANLTPGNGVGTITLAGGLTINSGATVTMQLNSSSHDSVAGGGSVNFGSSGTTLSLNLSGYARPSSETTYNLFTAFSTYLGNFSTISLSNNTQSGMTLADFSFNASNGTLTVVPEPSTWALLSVGAAFVVWRMRRRVRLVESLGAGRDNCSKRRSANAGWWGDLGGHRPPLQKLRKVRHRRALPPSVSAVVDGG